MRNESSMGSIAALAEFGETNKKAEERNMTYDQFDLFKRTIEDADHYFTLKLDPDELIERLDKYAYATLEMLDEDGCDVSDVMKNIQHRAEEAGADISKFGLFTKSIKDKQK